MHTVHFERIKAMKKAILCILLVLTATALLLSACGSKETSPAATQQPASTEQPASETAPAEEETPGATDVPAVTEEPETPASTEEPTPSPVPTADPSIAKGTNVALTAEIVDVSSTTGETHVQWGWS